jgi:hypothetical protein
MDTELVWFDCNDFRNDIRLFRKHLAQLALASRECDEMIAKSLALLSDSRKAMLRADRVLHQDCLSAWSQGGDVAASRLKAASAGSHSRSS